MVSSGDAGPTTSFVAGLAGQEKSCPPTLCGFDAQRCLLKEGRYTVGAHLIPSML